MDVILQEKVLNLGNVGDVVKVKPGYARNYLLPSGKSLRATNENIKAFESRRAELELRALELLNQAKARLVKLQALVFIIEVASSEEGRLFGSVGPRDIAEAATAMGVALSKSEVQLPEGPIRAVGEYDVDVILHSDVHARIKVTIKALA